MNDTVIREGELQVLINSLEEIRVTYPLYEGEIMVARPEGTGFSLELPASRETFQDWLAEYEPIAGELPSYADLQECMFASGIARYVNQTAFESMLASYGQLKKAVFFGLDTNLFYHGFASNNPRIDHASYLIVDTVRDEITYAINRKYPAKTIGEMTTQAPVCREYIAELENKRMKRSRKAAYLALKEYRTIRDRATEIAAPGPHTHLSEENDHNIVRALRRFEEERYALPVLLTADIYMADLCMAEGLEYFYFDRPYRQEATICTAQAFRRLLFNIAAVFGFVDCNGIAIFGEYGGKGNDLDELKVRFRDDEAYRAFMRELKICRNLTALGITR
ncbi:MULTISPECIES: PIN domain-containing protein [Methanoculleus]|uniref:PIN domain-containing protein n=2 Tax=Methanoculleus TaxID=45989 RepID=A3CVR3_METMJ|nr:MULTISPECIES: hypothetical protein [Methanoculleus]ABN57463.1 conserved hypothetical protein [Methanoculleus marisnigri JR1]MCC7556094.1 hypothetical protein [Methanoculleus marisnigri]UYU18868.1 hypothetical protein OH143_01885 [Methanoculleus submarinus]